MSFEALAIKIKSISEHLDSQMPDVMALAVMGELSAMHKTRIFDNGLDTDGNPLPAYSEKEGYYSKDEFVRKQVFKPVGKPDKNGKRRINNKTMFLAKGYSELRDIQGRTIKRKNLKYTGSLEAGINVVKDGASTLYGTTSAAESIKVDALEEQYKVFGLSNEEKEFLRTEITEQAIVIAQKA